MPMLTRLPKFLRAALPLAVLTAAACGGPGADGSSTGGFESPQQSGSAATTPVPDATDSSNGGVAIPAPTPAAPAPAEAPKGGGTEADVFGVTMLHPTKVGGETWIMKERADADPRFEPQKAITRNGDGSWKMQNAQVRMQVHTSASTTQNPPVVPTYDRNQLAQKGYMSTARDWRNIEMTGFVKLNRTSAPDDGFTWYARGGHHNDENNGCEGSAYKGDLDFNGRARIAKESWHVQYDYTQATYPTRALQGRWVGFKAVLRNVSRSGTTAVHVETYLNDNADGVTWKKMQELTDAGWGEGASHCGGSPDNMPITWGGPLATFRWDNAEDVDFKWLSVREIDPE
jgi:hypothetical protein